MEKLHLNQIIPALQQRKTVIISGFFAPILEDIIKEYERRTACGVQRPDFWGNLELTPNKFYLLYIEEVGMGKKRPFGFLEFWGACKALQNEVLEKYGAKIAGVVSTY